MPSYITHAIMMDELYKQSENDNHIFKIDQDISDLRTFSLGTDLCAFSKAVLTSHNKDTRTFFLSMIEYIKSNNLINDKTVMSCLYGHIAHYFLDKSVHPLVYYIEKGSYKSSYVPTHTLIEGFYDKYLIDSKGYKKIYPEFFNKGNLNNKTTNEVIDFTYRYTYNQKKIINSYKTVIKTFTILENLTRGIFTTDQLVKLSRFDKFLEYNEYTIDDLLNKKKEEWKNPISGEKKYESFNELYNDGLNETLNAIETVNKYLYENENISCLWNIFNNISYDTGVECEMGREFKYVKERIKK